jgi:hypothetical protein
MVRPMQTTIIVFLYIIHRPIFYLKQRFGDCLHLQVKPTQLGPIDRASSCSTSTKQLNPQANYTDRPPLVGVVSANFASGLVVRVPGCRSRVRFPALPDFLRSSWSGTGSIQPRESN